MANELFQFTIIDYTTNPLGDATLIQEPIGWDGVEFELQRLETHGFVNRINVDNITFEFRGAAKIILENIYNNFGQEAKVELQIEWRGNPVDAFQEVYRGLFKFNTYKITCGLDCFVSCGIAQDGDYYLFANRKNLPVNLSLLTSYDGTSLPPYTWLNNYVEMPSKAIKLENKTTANGSYSYTNTFIAPFTTVNDYEAGLYKIKQTDLVTQVNDFLTIEDNTAILTSLIAPGNGYFKIAYNENSFTPDLDFQYEGRLNCSNNFTINIDVDIDWTVTGQGGHVGSMIGGGQGVGFYLNLLRPDGTEQGLFFSPISTVLQPPATTHTGNTTESFSVNVNLNKGDKLFYGMIINNISRFGSFATGYKFDYTINSFNCEITNQSICESTFAKVSMVNEVLARQVESYTNNNITVKSDYFGRTDSQPYTSDNDGCGSMEVLTNGLQVRNAIDETSALFPFISNFDFVFNNLSKIHNLGYGLEPDLVKGGNSKWIRIEPFKYFYQNTILKFCDFPDLVTTNVDAKANYSGISIGYSNWATEQDGGLQDVFASREYSTMLTRTNNLLNLKSDLVASDFALEVVRRLYGTSKTDFRYDDKIFIVCMYRNTLDQILVEQGSSPEDGYGSMINNAVFIYDAVTMKNARITPVRNLLRHVPQLIKYLKPLNTWELVFTNGEANYKASIQLHPLNCLLEDTNYFLTENQNVNVSTFDDPAYALPAFNSELVNFTYPMNCADWAIILANPYGKIAYICPNDPDYSYGYIDKIKFKPTQGIADITLKKVFN